MLAAELNIFVTCISFILISMETFNGCPVVTVPTPRKLRSECLPYIAILHSCSLSALEIAFIAISNYFIK